MAGRMTDTWRLDVLPNDVLLIIFDYCNEYDLYRLSRVCKRFHEIIRTDVPWVKKSKRYLVTNQMSERFRKRCNIILYPRCTWFVSYNWHYGIYDKETICSKKTKMMPWMNLTSDILWWCGGNELLGFTRDPTGARAFRDPRFMYIDNDCYYTELYANDISKFVPWKNFIICGHTDGTINYYLLKNYKSTCPIAKMVLNNRSCVTAIDATSENLILGLEGGIIQMQKHPDMDTPGKKVYDGNEICRITDMDKVLSVSVDPTGVKFAVGSSGVTDLPPLHIINVERYTIVNIMRHEWQHGAGILDMVWDDPNTLLTCGYDTYIRKWDLRTERCVCSWVDPTDATLYCIASDHQYSMVTGTQHNCLAVLWDQRKTDFVQLYYVNKRSSQRSPIYSIQFDNKYLYCATDRDVFELNFSVKSFRPGKKRDYKSLYIPLCGLPSSCR